MRLKQSWILLKCETVLIDEWFEDFSIRRLQYARVFFIQKTPVGYLNTRQLTKIAEFSLTDIFYLRVQRCFGFYWSSERKSHSEFRNGSNYNDGDALEFIGCHQLTEMISTRIASSSGRHSTIIFWCWIWCSEWTLKDVVSKSISSTDRWFRRSSRVV